MAELLVDQSGLSAGYVNGVTDLDAYAATNPTHLGTSGVPITAGYFATAGAVVDIDLGETLTVTRLGLWNDNDAQGVLNFHLQIADNAGFVGAVSLGAFVATYGNNNNTFLDYNTGTPLQLFDLADATGRYVRVTFVDPHDFVTHINVGELIFGVGDAAVPAPAPLALLGLGLLALGIARRKS